MWRLCCCSSAAPPYYDESCITVKNVQSTDGLERFLKRGVCWGLFSLVGKPFPTGHAYVITLSTTPLRMARAIAALQNGGYAATICIMAPPDDSVYAQYQSTGTMKRGELGCTASHAWVLQYAATKHARITVLEDDVDFNTALTSTHALSQPVCLLGASDWHMKTRTLDAGFYVAHLSDGRVCGSFAYSLTAAAARTLRTQLLAPPLRPADHALHTAWPALHVLTPPMFLADRTTTSIDGHEHVDDAVCYRNVSHDSYVRIPVAALARIDCKCWTHWPWPLSCERCRVTHAALCRALRESKWSNEAIGGMTRVALGLSYSRGMFLAPPLIPQLPKDLAVVVATFNPCNFARPVANLLRTIDQFKGILPVFVVELLYPWSTSSLIAKRGVSILRVRGASIMFQKENLWAIAEHRVPSQYTKIAFLDGDILLDNVKTWASRVSSILCEVNVIQPLSAIKFEDPEGTTQQPLLVACSTVRETLFDPQMAYPSPGYGLALQRGWLRSVGGLIEMAVSGAGDLFTLGGLCASTYMRTTQAYKESPFAHADIERFIRNASGARVGYVPHEALHLYHGKRAERQYTTRHKILAGLTAKDFKRNAYGVVEYTDSVWNSHMKAYFHARREDD